MNTETEAPTDAESSSAAMLLARLLRVITSLVPVVALGLSIMWWAAGIERRLSLIEQTVQVDTILLAELPRRVELAAAQRQAQIERIEDRMNAHVDSDKAIFNGIASTIRPPAKGPP